MNIVQPRERDAIRSVYAGRVVEKIKLCDVVKAILASEMSAARGRRQCRVAANRCSLYGPRQMYRRTVTVRIRFHVFFCVYIEQGTMDENERETQWSCFERGKGNTGNMCIKKVGKYNFIFLFPIKIHRYLNYINFRSAYCSVRTTDWCRYPLQLSYENRDFNEALHFTCRSVVFVQRLSQQTAYKIILSCW